MGAPTSPGRSFLGAMRPPPRDAVTREVSARYSDGSGRGLAVRFRGAHRHRPAPAPAARVAVAGVSGSGKSTLVAADRRDPRRAAHRDRRALPRSRLDASGPSSRPTSRRSRSAPGWVTEWQYDVRAPAAGRARRPAGVARPAVPGRRCSASYAARCVAGCGARSSGTATEPPLHTFFTDPSTSCAGRSAPGTCYAERCPALAAAHPDLVVVRLRQHARGGPLARALLQPLA